MPEASDTLIASLNKRIETLESDKAGLAAEAKNRRLALKKVNAELEALRADGTKGTTDLQKQIDALTADRDTWKTKAESSPSEWKAKADDLAGKLRDRDHRDAWKDAVKAVKAGDAEFTLHEKASIDTLWRELNYKPEADQVDATAITGLVGKALEAHPYLFQPAGETPAVDPRGSKTVEKPLETGFAPSRGVRDTTSSKLRVSKADLRDPERSQQLQPKIAEARDKGVTVEYVD